MRFWKYQGLGNDFILIDGTDGNTVIDPGWCEMMCDRHFGIGADGVLYVLPGEGTDITMRIINADGSEAEMCGNGIRCVAKYAYDKGLVDGTVFTIHTLAGDLEATVTLEDGEVGTVRINMGAPILDGRQVPVDFDGRFIDQPFEAEGVKFRFLVSPLRIKGSDGRAAELELQLMAQGEADGSGRRKAVALEGQTETIPASTVISAIGQRVDWGELLAGSRVQLRRSGAAMADRVTLQTMEPDIFVGGDALTGPSFVIDAIAEGKEAAISIHRFVQPGQSLTIGRRVKDYMELDKSDADLSGYDRAPRQHAAAPDPAKAKETFRDLRGTFTAEQVMKETERCLGCGATVVDQSACVGCGVCTTKCQFDAIHLVRVTDESGKVYEKLMPESGKNLARRVKEIAVKRVARPRSK